jgi:hypothetical protein
MIVKLEHRYFMLIEKAKEKTTDQLAKKPQIQRDKREHREVKKIWRHQQRKEHAMTKR